MGFDFVMKGNTYGNDFWSMWDAYYPEMPSSMANKGDTPYLTTTTGVRQILYAPGLTMQFVTAPNFMGSLPDVPWEASGRRTITAAYFGSTPGDGAAEGSAIAYSTTDTVDTISYAPKQLENVIEMSLVELAMEGRDNVAKWTELVDARREIILSSNDRAMLAYGGQTAAGVNLESVDRVVASYDEYVNAGESPASNIYDYEGKNRHSAATVYDAQVIHYSGTPTRFTLKAVDDITFKCLPAWAGGSVKDKQYLTGFDTGGRMTQLIKSQFVKVDNKPVQYTAGGIKTIEGSDGPVFLNFYNGMPIVMDNFVDQHYTSSLTGLSKFYALDKQHLQFWMASPWQYMENTEPLLNGKMGRRGMFMAIGELACDKFIGQGKVMCIN